MTSTTENPLPWLADRILTTRFEDLPPNVIARAKVFLLDTFGVGVAGCNGFLLSELIGVAERWGKDDEATVWVSGQKLPAGAAAFINAYQIHSLEYDCVNEQAVLHPMATILSAMMAYAERRSREGRPVSGRDFLTACVLGVDISSFLGIVANGGIRFFRPATAGGFGAAAAIAKLEGFDKETLLRTFGTQYAQTCGTMQSHVEGSPLLGMQVGFNARASITSCDLSNVGLLGPIDAFTGRYGYLRLFENDDFDVDHGIAELKAAFQMERMSHKPFPTGRLTHGAIDTLHRLMAQHRFGADDIASVTFAVPPLVHRLVGRPDIPEPAPNYAKLCLQFVAATYLNHGAVDVEHFIGAEMLNNPRTHDLAARMTVTLNDVQDQNTMVPQSARVVLHSGKVHEITLEAVYGHPDAPLTQAEHLAKFRRCWARSDGLKPEAGEELIRKVEAFDTLADVTDLIPLLLRQP